MPLTISIAVPGVTSMSDEVASLQSKAEPKKRVAEPSPSLPVIRPSGGGKSEIAVLVMAVVSIVTVRDSLANAVVVAIVDPVNDVFQTPFVNVEVRGTSRSGHTVHVYAAAVVRLEWSVHEASIA